jgi:hypothetical protein
MSQAGGSNPLTTLQYVTAAQEGGSDGQTFVDPFDQGVEVGSKSKLLELVSRLDGLSDKDLDNLVSQTISRASQKRLGQQATSANLVPLISDALKTIVIPASFKNPDNYIGHYIIAQAKELNYSIKLLPVEQEKLTDITEYDSKIGLGIFMSLHDGENQFRFTKKTDPYEIGRTIVRSQQIIGFLAGTDKKAGPEVLKANNFYFGNVQSKTAALKKDLEAAGVTGKGKAKQSVATSEYWFKTAPSLFQESMWSQQLSKILVTLMRKSYVFCTSEALWDNIVPNMMSYSDVVRSYCTRSIVTVPARGRAAAVTVERVPTKPRNNNLLLKQELSLIDRLSSCLWEPTIWEDTPSDEWARILLANGLDLIKSDLAKVYNGRAVFLSKLAAVTTKRLQAIRALPGDLKNKRKSDITPDILANLLLSRSNLTDALVSEITALDPSGDLFLKEWASGSRLSSLMTDKSSVVMDNIRRAIAIEITRDGFYSELRNASAEQTAALTHFQNRISAELAAKQAWLDNLNNRYGQSTTEKWKANLRDFDPYDVLANRLSAMGIHYKPKNKGKKPIPPHGQKKPTPGISNRERLSKLAKESKELLAFETRALKLMNFGIQNTMSAALDEAISQGLSHNETAFYLSLLCEQQGVGHPMFFTVSKEFLSDFSQKKVTWKTISEIAASHCRNVKARALLTVV